MSNEMSLADRLRMDLGIAQRRQTDAEQLARALDLSIQLAEENDRLNAQLVETEKVAERLQAQLESLQGTPPVQTEPPGEDLPSQETE